MITYLLDTNICIFFIKGIAPVRDRLDGEGFDQCAIAEITYAELLARNGMSELVADGNYDPVEEASGPKAVFSFAAVFAEVRVDPDLGLVRLNRFVGAYDAGRIVNPKTARSQASCGIRWGVGQELLEQGETDPTTGR